MFRILGTAPLSEAASAILHSLASTANRHQLHSKGSPRAAATPAADTPPQTPCLLSLQICLVVSHSTCLVEEFSLIEMPGFEA